MPIWRQPPQPQQRVVKTIVISAIQMSLSDTITIADIISKGIAIPRAETLAIADSITTKDIGLNKADTITIADLLAKVSEFNYSILDAIAIADTISKAIGIPKSDIITIADLADYLKSISLSLSDTVAISDSISKAIGLDKADAVAIADLAEYLKAIALSLADSITIADSHSKEIGQVHADTITIADLAAYLKALALYLSDTISIADVLSKNIGITKADVIAITEGTERIIGSANVSVEDVADIDYFYLSKFTAEKSGDVTRIKVYCQGTLNVKVAMYEDNAGEPGDLMNAVDTAQAIVDGWNEIVFPATAIVQGTDYWLAFNSG